MHDHIARKTGEYRRVVLDRLGRVTKLYGAIEAGGTKFVCLVGNGPNDIVAETRFPTQEPGPTLDQAMAFFRSAASA